MSLCCALHTERSEKTYLPTAVGEERFRNAPDEGDEVEVEEITLGEAAMRKVGGEGVHRLGPEILREWIFNVSCDTRPNGRGETYSDCHGEVASG